MKTIRSLIPLFRLHKWGFPAIVLLGLLMSLTEGVGIGLFIPLLNGLVAGAPPAAKGQWIVETMNGLFQAVPPDRRFAIILTCVFAGRAGHGAARQHSQHAVCVARWKHRPRPAN